MSETYEGQDRSSGYSTPRWVKGFVVIALVIALLIAIMLLSGREHGPGLHMPPTAISTQQP